jgi:hypothetical protein
MKMFVMDIFNGISDKIASFGKRSCADVFHSGDVARDPTPIEVCAFANAKSFDCIFRERDVYFYLTSYMRQKPAVHAQDIWHCSVLR